MKCEFNPSRPCPLNDGEDHCTASWRDVELVLAPYGWLKCMTREKAEQLKEKEE